MKNKTIFIADHLGQFSKSVSNYLYICGFEVIIVDNKADAFHKFRNVQPDLVIIHEFFFESNLSRVIKIIHIKNKNLPIILIVSNKLNANIVNAFYSYVSDCVTVDINPIVLLQKIQRCLTTLAPNKLKIPFGQRSLYLPQASQILFINEERIILLPQENELLLLLCNSLGELCAKEELVRTIWGQKNQKRHLPQDHWSPNLNDLVCRLKKKMLPIDCIHIENIKKIGYRLCLK